MTRISTLHWKDRMRASGIHLGLSMLVAVLAALLVLGLWYPYPYREISGGAHLFLMVVSIDVILGPLITLAVFNRSKLRSVLIRDLAAVVAVQLAALSYGLWVVSVARPVHLVYEFDRFSVVHAIEVPPELVDRTQADVHALPWTGPTVLAVRPFENEKEKVETTMMALQGLPVSVRADLWQPYAQARLRVLAAAMPLTDLNRRFPQQSEQIAAAVAKSGAREDGLRYLPLVSRQAFWTVLLDANTAEVRGFIALDSF